jgi:hypothetical protein
MSKTLTCVERDLILRLTNGDYPAAARLLDRAIGEHLESADILRRRVNLAEWPHLDGLIGRVTAAELGRAVRS